MKKCSISVFQKVICTNYNKNSQTAQLRDNHIILEQLMRRVLLFPIVVLKMAKKLAETYTE